MEQQKIDLTKIADDAFAQTASAQRVACSYGDTILQYPRLLDAIVTANDDHGHFAFTARPDRKDRQLSVTVTAPNQEQFVLASEWDRKVRSQTLGAGESATDKFGTYVTGSPADTVRDLVAWCAARTPPAYQESLYRNLKQAEDAEAQRQAGIRGALAEEGLAQTRVPTERNRGLLQNDDFLLRTSGPAMD